MFDVTKFVMPMNIGIPPDGKHPPGNRCDKIGYLASEMPIFIGMTVYYNT